MKKIIIISALLALVCGGAAAQSLDEIAKQQQVAVDNATQAYKDQANKSARQIERLEVSVSKYTKVILSLINDKILAYISWHHRNKQSILLL